MDKTIKEVAEELGVSKQAVQYHVKSLPTKDYFLATKGKQKQIMIKPSGLQALREKVANKETDKQPTKTDKKSDKRQTKSAKETDKEKEGNKEEFTNNLNIELQTKVAIQEKEIELLRERIKELENDRNYYRSSLDKAITNVQTIEQRLLIEQTSKQEPVVYQFQESREQEPQKKSWFQKLFNK